MTLKNIEGIKNIIFDLGNVIIDLDTEATKQDFKFLYGPDYEEVMADLKERNVFKKFETGSISTQTFLNELASYDDNITFDEIKNAWSAMLLDIPEENYKILKKTKENYKTFCLSNTNKLHIDFIYKQLKSTKGVTNLNGFFEKVYLSHEVGKRKPNEDIFQLVLDNHNLVPSETLFIDDIKKHLVGAEKLGIRTLHMDEDMRLSDIFN
ncbi:MAG: HAD family phosphatase [Vicingaceae bacterium]|jgi:FMN phosphatase YigB (HAD superfamily)|tara:strand:+ start:580 stop:1206 length:627 start_codon:yes stop_codon:yes gene_type:complete